MWVCISGEVRGYLGGEEHPATDAWGDANLIVTFPCLLFHALKKKFLR